MGDETDDILGSLGLTTEKFRLTAVAKKAEKDKKSRPTAVAKKAEKDKKSRPTTVAKKAERTRRSPD